MPHLKAVMVVLMVVVLAGCAGRDAVTDDADDPDAPGGPGTGPGGVVTPTNGVAGMGDMQALEPDPDDPLLSNVVVYFDFDRDEVRQEFVDVLRAHARFLNGNSQRRVRLEGHTDERGSREYNIGLGERRALSVRRFLLLEGVSADQITTVSYGEERPLDLRSNEDAWERNRRVELVYRQ